MPLRPIPWIPLLCWTLAGAAPAARATAFAWPKDRGCAVSLTYDDALQSQIDNVGPALQKRGLRATFFLSDPAGSVEAHAAAWKALEKDGQELACHTILHPCGGSQSWVKPGDALEDYNLARMAKELQSSMSLLESLGASPPLSFAFPCGETWVGKKHVSYIPLVRKDFLAARGVDQDLADPNTVDLYQVPIVNGTGTNGPYLISAVQEAQKDGSWVVFMFHGVGGDYLQVPLKAHDQLLDYLQAHKQVWTAPFGQVAGWIKSARKETAQK